MISKEQADFVRSLADVEGHLEPAHVIEIARDPATPIHSEFTWDDAEAAKLQRMDQARCLIRFVRLEVKISRQVILAPFYVPDPQRPPKSKRYVDLTIASRNESLAQQILSQELDRVVQCIRRAQEVAIVLGLEDQLAALLENVANLKTQAEIMAEEKAKAKSKKPPPAKRRPGRPRKGGRPELRA